MSSHVWDDEDVLRALEDEFRLACFACGHAELGEVALCAGCGRYACDQHSEVQVFDGVWLCCECIAACDVAPVEGPKE